MNQVQLFGRIGQDPEVRYTGDGTAVVNLRMATSQRYKDKAGERQEVTQWHNLVAFGERAEVIHEYVSKGDQFIVSKGTIQYRTWEDRDGNERESTEIKVLDFELVSNGRGQGQSQQKEKQPAGGAEGEDETFEPDDELPF